MSNPYIPQESYNQDTYTLPGFRPERVEDVYEHITQKYYCQERVVSASDQFTTLTFRIQQPDLNMVMKNCKIQIPVSIVALNRDGQTLSTSLSDRLPACNVALSAHLQRAFTDIQLSINGKIFTINPSSYQEVLDVCYVSKDADSFSSNHSLKPNATRNLQSREEYAQNYPLLLADGQPDNNNRYIRIGNLQTAVSDHAFDLSFANGPYVERVRDWQRIISRDTDHVYRNIIGFNLQVGPFMDRARKRSNKAVPFVRDMTLTLRWKRDVSQFDISNEDARTPNYPNRTICNGLLEWGTPMNLHHQGESALPTDNWASGGFRINITAKPYLQVAYVKMGGLAPSYTLRALSYRYEKSSMFPLPPAHMGFGAASASSTAVINSRLTSFPSKVYLYCELADGFKSPFFMGGTSRLGKLDNIRLRINQRTNVVDNPTEVELYENFKMLTSNGLEKPTWTKSPVYVFSCDVFGQPDMKSGDGVVSTFEWQADCSLSELMVEELTELGQPASLASMGYANDLNWVLIETISGVPTLATRFYFDHPLWPAARYRPSRNPLHTSNTSRYMHSRDTIIAIETSLDKVQYSTGAAVFEYCPLDSMDPQVRDRLFKGRVFRQNPEARWVAANPGKIQSGEQFRVDRVLGLKYRYDGLIWGVVDATNGQSPNMPLVPINGQYLFWVPESFEFDFDYNDIYDNYDNQQSQDVVHSVKGVANPTSVINWAAKTVNNPNIITGNVTSKDFARITVGAYAPLYTKRYKFNPEQIADADDDGWCPGPRGYPVSIGTGIHLDGKADKWDRNAGAYVVQGGIPAQAHHRRILAKGEADHQYGLKCIDPVAHPGYKWVAFQLSDSARTNNANADSVNGRFAQRSPVIANYNNGNQIADGNNMIPGMTQYQRSYALNGQVEHACKQTIIARCSVSRHVFGAEHPDTVDLQQGRMANPGNPADNTYNRNQNKGLQLQFSEAAPNNAIQNSLRYEMKALYEFGEEQYLFKADGSKPEKFNNIIVDAQMARTDPRLQQDYTLKAPPDDSGIAYT